MKHDKLFQFKSTMAFTFLIFVKIRSLNLCQHLEYFVILFLKYMFWLRHVFFRFQCQTYENVTVLNNQISESWSRCCVFWRDLNEQNIKGRWSTCYLFIYLSIWFPYFNLLAKNWFCWAISGVKRNQILSFSSEVWGRLSTILHSFYII